MARVITGAKQQQGRLWWGSCRVDWQHKQLLASGPMCCPWPVQTFTGWIHPVGHRLLTPHVAIQCAPVSSASWTGLWLGATSLLHACPSCWLSGHSISQTGDGDRAPHAAWIAPSALPNYPAAPPPLISRSLLHQVIGPFTPRLSPHPLIGPSILGSLLCHPNQPVSSGGSSRAGGSHSLPSPELPAAHAAPVHMDSFPNWALQLPGSLGAPCPPSPCFPCSCRAWQGLDIGAVGQQGLQGP